MELKLYSNSEIQAPDALLIVPYGIETSASQLSEIRAKIF